MTKTLKIVEKKNLWYLISIVFIAVGIFLMIQRALTSNPVLNFGIDFVGGTSMILRFDALTEQYNNTTEQDQEARKSINSSFIRQLRESLQSLGLEKSSIQISEDNEILIKTNLLDNDQSTILLNRLRAQFGTIEVLEIDFIGPSIGAELREKSFWLIIFTSVAMLLYITWRFEFSFGIAAVIALIHDALVTISFASIFNIEITTVFIAALLTVLGYSINDTIVTFDRLRENLNLLRRNISLEGIANLSIIQTLTRTLYTALTTIIMIGSLLIFGGTTIKSFCLVILVGIIAGVYSSIFIASPILVSLSPKE